MTENLTKSHTLHPLMCIPFDMQMEKKAWFGLTPLRFNCRPISEQSKLIVSDPAEQVDK